MKSGTIALLGGAGFVGAHLAALLVERGYRVRILTRRRERHRDLLVLPTATLFETDVHAREALAAALAGCDAVVNLVGILNERGDDGSGFRRAHVTLAQSVVAACAGLGIGRLLHMSALNADPGGPSHYLRTKGEAENLVHAAAHSGFAVTSFRPSVIFGPGDRFLNRFAGLLAVSPILPLARPQARFAPVYVGDVAQAFVRALEDRGTAGRRYELCGPQVLSLLDIVRYCARVRCLRRGIVGLPDWASRLQAEVLEHVPGKPLSRDNLRSLARDSVCTGESGLAALGIAPTPMGAIVPQYLAPPAPGGRYGAAQRLARR